MKRLAKLHPWWAARAPRERLALVTAAVVLALGLLWSLAIAPAWRTLRDAPAQRASLAPQWERMRGNAAEAQQLLGQKAPPLPRSESERALQTATQRHLGSSAQVSLLGDRASVTLQDVPAGALALWLEEVRVNARLTPGEAQLTQTLTAATPSSADIRWSGTVVLSGSGLATP